ncbi:Asp-tRNA(Asn)/Glu-tRNA(Gln) amidotransferase subunit GatB [Legionella dresdenensis]|uniref:Aspartyl/glutamyl-tRNA(Asn/Gln) amidotransferase subunit B n=1 Tax=Legionella dresdenensis TaxID=450200 RepID=A0ABV8CC05_9GAMM
MMWDTVIGLEVHVQLQTRSKLFSGSATGFGAAPNSQTSFIDAGLPGVLPVLNQQAVKMAIQLGMAINAEINDLSYFERKNYFYPDLPKGYQISQYQRPIVSNGELAIETANGIQKTVTIVRAHLEEDAGKSIHDAHADYTGIDLNRAGMPLLEIVTSPCLYSAEEAIAYLKALHQLVRFLGICDGNMQEGSFRCDVNISLKPAGASQLGTRTELKNLNSFRFIEKAIRYEQARHQDLLESGLRVAQETRLFCPDTETTQVMRSKENEHDYRYFPDPDLLPIAIDSELLTQLKQTLPLLPWQIKEQLINQGQLNADDIAFVLSSPAAYQFFTAVSANSESDQKTICNWLKGAYAAALNNSNLGFENAPVPASVMADLLNRLQRKEVTAAIAKKIFVKLWEQQGTIDEIIKQENYSQSVDDNQLEPLIQTIVQQHPQQAADYRNGKDKLLGFFVGLVMKQTKGQADPELVNQLLKKYLAG